MSRYVSQLFQPFITIPKNAKIKNTEITCKSQKLLLECGLLRPTSSGLFSLLPLARRSLDKLERLIVSALDDIGAQRLTFPALTSEGLWDKTGRLDAASSELLKVEDRHGKRFLLSPTHEEAVADLLSDVGPLSYKQLPLLIYQIGNKYRDEHRPKHGLLRAREFSMLDAYGAHADQACAKNVYERVSDAYRRLFNTLKLPVHRVSAPSGEMGGSYSHEWQLCASAGEDAIDICPSCSHTTLSSHDQKCDQCGRQTNRVNSIEVGHTFILGSKYSEPLGAHFVPASGPPAPLTMSCYGIGITRLLAASLEALSTETCLRWPQAIAPYTTIIIGPKEGSKEWSNNGWQLAQDLSRLLARREEVLVDDRHHLTIGKRVMMADKVGYPTIIVCGKSTLDNPPKFEVYRDYEATPSLMTFEEISVGLDCDNCIKRNNEINL